MVGDREQPSLKMLLGQVDREEIDLKRVLRRLAYKAHKKSNREDDVSLADIGVRVRDMDEALALLHPNKSLDWAREVIETMKLRAGLLIEREPGIFSFPHRTFQEYLAGAHLSLMTNFSTEVAKLLEDTFWREAVLLAVGRLVHITEDFAKPLALVGEICPKDVDDSETGWRKVWVAGEILVEIGRHRVEESNLGKDLLDRVHLRLVDLLEKGRLAPKERAAAGNVLSLLGDPRFDPNNWYLPVEEMFGFVKIPEGTFLMGSDSEADGDAEEDVMPQHQVALSDYWIGRYPVTVAQYRVFAEDTGHALGDDWEKFNRFDNHPVVNVSWDDAMAYCHWLTNKLKDQAITITLPTEAQWERAARGINSTIFPWANKKIDHNMANYGGYKGEGKGGQSVVGCFPMGRKREEELHDMSGNVWEWCQDWYGKDYYTESPDRDPTGPKKDSYRVVRWGSWFNGAWD